MKTPLATALVFATLGASAMTHAQAQTCGNPIHASVSLTADLVCPAGSDGLVVGADNLRIDLNGYAIRGPGGAGTSGIYSSGFKGIKVTGPGGIAGFDMSVSIDGGDYHEIRGIDAGTPSTMAIRGGIWLRNTSNSVVDGNRAGRIDVGADAGLRATGNRITGNDADSISVHGCQASNNEIARNDIHPVTQFVAVGLAGSTGNQVVANRIVSGSVWLGGSSQNVVSANTITNAAYPSWVFAGVLMGHFPSPCIAAVTMVEASKNVVSGNAIEGGHVGVVMAEGARDNKIFDNKIYGQIAAGINFRAGADNNDARTNWYGNVPIDVVDMGQGNLWP